mmetsp:Transcript_5165/g.12722  ORF Transcript_5165/g.12722 Transcript_5165/m.12722 type:complete len:221 (+) Transcript_5165:3415-4077(+)
MTRVQAAPGTLPAQLQAHQMAARGCLHQTLPVVLLPHHQTPQHLRRRVARRLLAVGWLAGQRCCLLLAAGAHQRAMAGPVAAQTEHPGAAAQARQKAPQTLLLRALLAGQRALQQAQAAAGACQTGPRQAVAARARHQTGCEQAHQTPHRLQARQTGSVLERLAHDQRARLPAAQRDPPVLQALAQVPQLPTQTLCLLLLAARRQGRSRLRAEPARGGSP